MDYLRVFLWIAVFCLLLVGIFRALGYIKARRGWAVSTAQAAFQFMVDSPWLKLALSRRHP